MLEVIHDFNGWMMMPIGLTFLLLELWLFKHLLIERSRGRAHAPTASQTRPHRSRRPPRRPQVRECDSDAA